PYPPFIDLWYVISGKSFNPTVPGVPAEQRLTREEALRAKTVGCAWNLVQEGRVGSLEVGKHADLIVLSDDYFAVSTDDLRGLTKRTLDMTGVAVVGREPAVQIMLCTRCTRGRASRCSATSSGSRCCSRRRHSSGDTCSSGRSATRRRISRGPIGSRRRSARP